MISTDYAKKPGYEVINLDDNCLRLTGSITWTFEKDSSCYEMLMLALKNTLGENPAGKQVSIFCDGAGKVSGIQFEEKGFIKDFVPRFGVCILYFGNRAQSRSKD